MSASRLAVDGGEPVRAVPWPARGLFGAAERDAVLALLQRCVDSGGVFAYGGRETAAYAEAFRDYLGGGLAHPVNSGTSALLAALAGCALEPLSEVIVPPITDPGGVMPVALLNLVPVVADAAPGSYNLGADQVAAVLTERTRAIVVAHIAGEPVPMDPILDLARRHQLRVIEDAAQAHGATDHGRLVGTLGDIAAFSTMSGKHHATGGQGGVIVSRDEALFARARRFADRGKPFGLSEPTNVAAGLNLNLDDLSALIGAVQLPRLPQIVAARQATAAQVAERLAAIDGASLGWQAPGCRSSYWYLRVHVDPAAIACPMGEFVRAVAAEGIPASWPYTHLTSHHAWFREQTVFGSSGWPWQAPGYAGDRRPAPELPNAVAARAECFNIALHERCGEREAKDIAAALRKVLAARHS